MFSKIVWLLVFSLAPITAFAAEDDGAPLGYVAPVGWGLTLVGAGIAGSSAIATVVLSGMNVHDAIANEEHDPMLITAGYAAGGSWVGLSALLLGVGTAEGHDDALFYGAIGSIAGLGALSLVTAMISDLTDARSYEPRPVHDDGIRFGLGPTVLIPKNGELAPGLALSFGSF